ncbi:MAG: asparagine--tRNA ligase [Acholeplasmatales bacterium]|jgi:asparaginyl-tRNA synthetase|nr:asparagine--tRNA ligase [Acholeplasmatales bacterium]
MKNFTVKQIYQALRDNSLQENTLVKIEGWVRNNRDQKEFGFIDFHDGTFFKSIQIVYENSLDNFKNIQKIRVGSSVTITGKLILTPTAKQPFEINALTVTLNGDSSDDYPIQPKRHSREFLREQAYLRTRTNLFQAVFRVRSVSAFLIHEFFQNEGFVYVNTPIITSNDGEGAGQMFNVTTLDLNNLPKTETNEVDYKQDFFGKKVSLTVTGQLEAESYALSFKNVYTFGPTFRAENSNTVKHAAEFWMIEPEMSFCDMDKSMEIQEKLVKYIISNLLKKLPDELEFFNQFVEPGLLARLNNVLNSDFAKITHEEAISILLNSKNKFENRPEYGKDIFSEHEKFLTEVHFKKPVFITDWPKDIKAFYMRLNDDNKTVRAADLLVPGSGELIGGSQREERIDYLEKRIKELQMKTEGLEWYINLRKYGGCIHSGFGLGFERLIMYLTGVDNIRDVIPFARTPKNCEY